MSTQGHSRIFMILLKLNLSAMSIIFLQAQKTRYRQFSAKAIDLPKHTPVMVKMNIKKFLGFTMITSKNRITKT
jgi:hypothetical protein